MDTNNLNQQNNESGSLTPPPEEELNIRTMGSDRHRPLEPEIPFAPSTPEPGPASKLGTIPSILGTIPTDETPKAIPDWAQEKIEEEEATTEPIARKTITFTIIILVIIIGFAIAGYWVAFFVFKR